MLSDHRHLTLYNVYSFQICLGYEKYIPPGALVSDLRRNSREVLFFILDGADWL